MRASILIADDHAILREAIRSLLAEQQDLEVVGEAGDGRSAVGMAGRLAPRVIIMDIGMPDLNGIEATRKVLAVSPGTRVIALSMHSEPDLLAEMLRAGASGYLMKSAAFSELLGAVRAVLDGQVYLSPAVAGAVVDGFVRHVPPPPDAAFSSLTPASAKSCNWWPKAARRNRSWRGSTCRSRPSRPTARQSWRS